MHAILTDVLVVLSTGVDELLAQLDNGGRGSAAERDLLHLVWRTVHYCVENLLYHIQRAGE